MSTTAQQIDFDRVQELVNEGANAFSDGFKKDELIAISEALGIEDTTGTKREIAGRIEMYAADEGLPTTQELKEAAKRAQLRGVSEVDSPVALVWTIADEMFARAAKNGDPKPRRKDVVAACQEQGVAYYTARTQYQSWHKHTDGGRKLIADGNTDGAPKGLLKEEEEQTEA